MVKKCDQFLIAYVNYISISFIPEVSFSSRKLLSIWKITSSRLVIYLFYIKQNKNIIDLIFTLFVVTFCTSTFLAISWHPVSQNASR